MASLIEKLHSVHDSLTASHLRHAFGGAIALAYCTEEPRGTRDLDVNVFIPAERAAEVVDALPGEVEHSAKDLTALVETGQTRLWWEDTPIDLFLNNVPYHDEVAVQIRWVPLAGRDVPILSCESLVVFKALFNRTKDWADIEQVAAVDAGIVSRASETVAGLVGENDAVVGRLTDVVRSAE